MRFCSVVHKYFNSETRFSSNPHLKIRFWHQRKVAPLLLQRKQSLLIIITRPKTINTLCKWRDQHLNIKWLVHMTATALSELPSQRGCSRRHAKYELVPPVRSGLRGPVDLERRFVSEPVRQVVLHSAALNSANGPRNAACGCTFPFYY